MNLQPAVGVDEAQLPEAVHEISVTMLAPGGQEPRGIAAGCPAERSSAAPRQAATLSSSTEPDSENQLHRQLHLPG